MAMAEGPPGDNLHVENLPPDVNDDVITSIFAAVGYTVKQSRILPNTTPGAGTCTAMVRFNSVEEAKLVRENLDGTELPGFDKPLQIRYAGSPRPSDGQGKGGYGKFSAQKWRCPHCGFNNSVANEVCGGSGNLGCKMPRPQSDEFETATGIEKGKGKSKGKTKGGGKSYSMQDIVDGFVSSGGVPGTGLDRQDDHCLYISGLPPDCDDFMLYRLFSPFGAIAPKGVKAMKHPDGTCKGFGFVNYVHTDSVHVASLTLHDTPKSNGQTLKIQPKGQKPGAHSGMQSQGNDGFADVLATAANLMSNGLK